MTNFTKVGLKLKPDFNKLIYFFSKTKKLKFAIRSANILMSCYSPILQLYQPKNYLVRKVYKLADLSKMSIYGIKCEDLLLWTWRRYIYTRDITCAYWIVSHSGITFISRLVGFDHILNKPSQIAHKLTSYQAKWEDLLRKMIIIKKALRKK